jgi:hypothetical protein
MQKRIEHKETKGNEGKTNSVCVFLRFLCSLLSNFVLSSLLPLLPPVQKHFRSPISDSEVGLLKLR